MRGAFSSWFGSSGTSAPFLGDGRQIQDLLDQLNDSYDVANCSDFSQDLVRVFNEAAALPAQGPLSPDADVYQDVDFIDEDFATAVTDEHYCVFGSY